MRLLSTHFSGSGIPEVCEFNSNNRPPYAILSHTWADNEVLFADLKSPDVAMRTNFHKIGLTLEQARRDGLEWAWIDTACINKDSSAELSEAINAMYNWYQEAALCYVYLSDYDSSKDGSPKAFSRSRWFRRGWTLQELLAPAQILFFDQTWKPLGTLRDLADDVATATGVGKEFLNKARSIYTASIALRMSWAASRSTTRSEDLAYCLMGLFNVNMPMLYGEGSRAFIRLQEEIMKDSDDQTLFAWRARCEDDRHGLLADSPAAFQGSGDVVPVSGLSGQRQNHISHAMTNRGLRIELPSRNLGDFFNGPIMMLLECQMQSEAGFVRIILHPTGESINHYARGECERLTLSNEPLTSWSSVYVRQNIPQSLTYVNAAFHFVTLLDFTTNAVREGRPRIQKGFYLDVLGHGEQWEPGLAVPQRYPIKVIRQAGVLCAFLILPDNPIGKVAVLIGSDYSRQLAFDVWEPTTTNGVAEYVRSLGGSSARTAMPPILAKAFEPHPPGTRMTKLRQFDITVSVEADPHSMNPVCGLRIFCYKKADVPPYQPAAPMVSQAKSKSSAKSLWKNMAGLSERRSQPS